MGLHLRLARLVLLVGNLSGPVQNGGKGQDARMRNVLQAHDAAQMGELFAVQLAFVLILEGGNDPVQGRHIVVVEKSVDTEEIFALGLTDEVLEFAVAVVGVHRQERGSYAGGREHERHPVRHVGGPEGYFFAGFDAQRHQAPSQPVHGVGKLAPGFVQHLAEGAFLQHKFRHIPFLIHAEIPGPQAGRPGAAAMGANFGMEVPRRNPPPRLPAEKASLGGFQRHDPMLLRTHSQGKKRRPPFPKKPEAFLRRKRKLYSPLEEA